LEDSGGETVSELEKAVMGSPIREQAVPFPRKAGAEAITNPSGGKRQTCAHWRQVETMMVWYKEPHKHHICTLFDVPQPRCRDCREWEPKPPKASP
jgi:hypothetical protein